MKDKVLMRCIDGRLVETEYAKSLKKDKDENHRLTLRIPKCLMARVDEERKKRVGKISRNLWILEILDKATTK